MIVGESNVILPASCNGNNGDVPSMFSVISSFCEIV